jgi:hypothetical protein
MFTTTTAKIGPAMFVVRHPVRNNVLWNDRSANWSPSPLNATLFADFRQAQRIADIFGGRVVVIVERP